jgi:hypothetical protein
LILSSGFKVFLLVKVFQSLDLSRGFHYTRTSRTTYEYVGDEQKLIGFTACETTECLLFARIIRIGSGDPAGITEGTRVMSQA